MKKSKSIFKFLLLFLCSAFTLISFSQEDALERAEKSRLSNPSFSIKILDSVIQHPQTKNDYVTWTTRAFVYYELYKKTDKLKLNSALRDSILSSIRVSNNLKPDSQMLVNNKNVVKNLALGYRKIAKVQLEDSLNYGKSEFAFSKYRELMSLIDKNIHFEANEIEFYSALSSVAMEEFNKKWLKNNKVDTNEYAFIFQRIQKVKDIANSIVEEPEKELSMSDKNYLKEKVKPINKQSVLTTAKLLNVFLILNKTTLERKNYQNESIEKQVALQVASTKNELNKLQLEKQRSEIELTKLKVDEQKNGLQLLEKDKDLKNALIEKQNAEAKESEEVLKQQRLLRNISFIGIFLLFIVLAFIYRNLSINRKQNKIITAKNIEVEKQNAIISEQKHLVEEKHKEITDSINYAERIQRSFLATKQMLDENLSSQRGDAEGGGGYFVFFKPKDVVSGDFYWAGKIRQLDNSAISKLGNEIASEVGTQLSNSLIDSSSHSFFLLATADSTGHGVPGAIMSLLNITSLEKAIENLSSPEAILNHTRKTIIERLKKDGSEHGGKDGMDCSLIAFDFKNKKLLIANANNPVWIVRGKEVTEIKADKMPVGKHDRDQESFTLKTFDFETGDVVYALTDGFPDQFGGQNGKKFMSKNLRELLVSNAQLPMTEQKQILETTFNNWVGELEQVDDVTVIGVRM